MKIIKRIIGITGMYAILCLIGYHALNTLLISGTIDYIEPWMVVISGLGVLLFIAIVFGIVYGLVSLIID